MAQLASFSRSKRSMPSREGTGSCVTTSAATRLAASGWLFIEDSLELGRGLEHGASGKVASCPVGWQAAMGDAVNRLSAVLAESVGPAGGRRSHPPVGAALRREKEAKPSQQSQAKKSPANWRG
ncbi:hypothetical protein PRtIB026_A02450 [Pseudomonas sp. RtIB026]|nr:hypothetical protein PRtIB026_A02450 [Pseudomonas sp. RtIB026]